MSSITQSYQPSAVVIWELEAGYSIQCGHEAATATSWDLAVTLARRLARLHQAEIFLRTVSGEFGQLRPRQHDDS